MVISLAQHLKKVSVEMEHGKNYYNVLGGYGTVLYELENHPPYVSVWVASWRTFLYGCYF